METAAADDRERRGEVNAETDMALATACLLGLDMEIAHSHVIEAPLVFGRAPQAGNRFAPFALSAEQRMAALQRCVVHANTCKDQ